jgi:hypothetical protein
MTNPAFASAPEIPLKVRCRPLTLDKRNLLAKATISGLIMT